MRKEIKFSKEQIEAIYNYINSNRSSSSNYENLKFLYNPNTPKDIYAKYVSYELMDDNGIMSNVNVMCVKPNGAISDCYDQFDDLKQRMAFAGDFIEIDLDSKGKMVFV